MENREIILTEFEASKEIYDQFKNATYKLIEDLLFANKINTHHISGRLKDKTSLDKKIKSKQNQYSKLHEITDVVGIRIITFFEDEVDEIAGIIKGEFDIDQVNTIDKRQKDYDRFGYSSLHFVVKMSTSRLGLTEYQNYNGLKIEIQIRSILQHAWAEIEHDLGYKSEESVPDHVKRNFSRVSALLETADLEFTKLKESIKTYESTVDDKVKLHPETIDLNMASFNSFVQNNETLLILDKEISRATETILNERIFEDAQTYLKEFELLNINSIQDLEEQLKKHKDKIVKFAVELTNNEDKDIPLSDKPMYIKGSSFFYLNYLLILEKDDFQLLNNFIKKYKGFNNSKSETTKKFIDHVMNSYNKTKTETNI